MYGVTGYLSVPMVLMSGTVLVQGSPVIMVTV